MQNVKASIPAIVFLLSRESARINKICSVKNIPACTNLSKDTNSSQEMCGIALPGILHKPKMMSVQIMKGRNFFIYTNFVMLNLFQHSLIFGSGDWLRATPKQVQGDGLFCYYPLANSSFAFSQFTKLHQSLI